MCQYQHRFLVLVSLLLMDPHLPQLTGASAIVHQGSDTGFNHLCRVMCSRKEQSCPIECAFSSLEIVKRTPEFSRARRFGDFSFDDYLFMKLLGRNLDDNSE